MFYRQLKCQSVSWRYLGFRARPFSSQQNKHLRPPPRGLNAAGVPVSTRQYNMMMRKRKISDLINYQYLTSYGLLTRPSSFVTLYYPSVMAKVVDLKVAKLFWMPFVNTSSSKCNCPKRPDYMSIKLKDTSTQSVSLLHQHLAVIKHGNLNKKNNVPRPQQT